MIHTATMIHTLAWFGVDNSIVVLVALLLLFGGRVPEVMRGLGKGIVEFKKGMHGIEDELDAAVKAKPQDTTVSRLPANNTAGYKFDPYTGKPLVGEAPASAMRFDPYTGKPIAQESATTGPTNSGTPLGA